HQLLSPADQERRSRALPPSHGYHARYRNLRDCLPGHQLRYGARHRSVLQKIVWTRTTQFTRLWLGDGGGRVEGGAVHLRGDGVAHEEFGGEGWHEVST